MTRQEWVLKNARDFHTMVVPLPYLPAWGLFLWDQDVDHIMTKRLCLTWACPADLEYSTDGLDITKKWLNWAIHSFDVSIVVLIFWFKLEGCRFGSGLGLYQGLPQYLNLRMITNRILGSEAFVHTPDDDVLGGHSNKNVQPQNMQPLQIWISSAVTSWMNTSEWPVRLVSEPWLDLIQFNLFFYTCDKKTFFKKK